MNLEKYSTHQVMNKRLGNARSTWKKRMSAYTKIVLALTLVTIVIFTNIVRKRVDRRSAMIEMHEPIIVEFPLRGEWLSPNTPGTKIPSHAQTN